jgi:hypothetical protein
MIPGNEIHGFFHQAPREEGEKGSFMNEEEKLEREIEELEERLR